MGGEQYAKNRTENGATGRTWHEFLRGRGTNHGLQKKLFEDMDKFIEANKDFKFVL